VLDDPKLLKRLASKAALPSCLMHCFACMPPVLLLCAAVVVYSGRSVLANVDYPTVDVTAFVESWLVMIAVKAVQPELQQLQRLFS